MRRTVYSVCAVLLVVVGLGSNSTKDYDDRTELNNIQGGWRLTKLESNGKEFHLGSIQNSVRIYRSGACTDRSGIGDRFIGHYRVDPSRKPAHLDMILSFGPRKGETLKCIYQIDGDTLRTAFMEGGNDMRRPQGFNDKDIVVYTYKRVK